jgi:DHA2 family methylenomycin A resistance protein-like MFS transporter
MIVLDTSIVNLALPRIKDVFHADLTALQWLVDGYALVFASLLLNAGRWAIATAPSACSRPVC